MWKLFDSQVSGNCYKVRLILNHLEIPYEREEIDVANRTGRVERLGDKNPAAKVPILQLDDGTCLAESNAILWHLADGTPYLSDEKMERTRTLQWMFFEQNNLESNVAVVRYWIRVSGEAEKFREAIKVRRYGGHQALATMNRWLGDHPFFVAGRYSIADIALFAYTHVAGEGGFALDEYPAVRAWIARVREQPGHVGIMEKGTVRV